MNHLTTRLPMLVTLLLCGALIAHGPIEQLAHYHEFADQTTLWGIPHAADVLSNIGFAIVSIWGMWGMLELCRVRELPAFRSSRYGYWLFLIGLLLTVFGSSFYHLAPDDVRLIWDRLPIALACAGLLVAVRAETVSHVNARVDVFYCSSLQLLASLGGTGPGIFALICSCKACHSF